MVARTYEGVRIAECGAQPRQLVEGVDLPGQVVEANRRPPGPRRSRSRAHLEQAEVVVVRRPGRLEERGSNESFWGHVDTSEAEYVAVERDASLD